MMQNSIKNAFIICLSVNISLWCADDALMTLIKCLKDLKQFDGQIVAYTSNSNSFNHAPEHVKESPHASTPAFPLGPKSSYHDIETRYGVIKTHPKFYDGRFGTLATFVKKTNCTCTYISCLQPNNTYENIAIRLITKEERIQLIKALKEDLTRLSGCDKEQALKQLCKETDVNVKPTNMNSSIHCTAHHETISTTSK